jgi:zinc and cadmium transporter
MLFLVIISTIIVSLISFVGILALIIKNSLLDKFLVAIVALSAGALLGAAFFHLIPESEELEFHSTLLSVVIGFSLFLLGEKLLHWQHCHKGKCSIHSFAYMNLVGDGIHNFIDGLTIGASFTINPHTGFATTIAVALHEIPQEIGDFGVLIYGGFEKIKAILLNFACALTAIIGGISGYLFLQQLEFGKAFLLSFAAGGFIYIAASDLIPEIRKEVKLSKALINFGIFSTGLLLMYILASLNHAH